MTSGRISRPPDSHPEAPHGAPANVAPRAGRRWPRRLEGGHGMEDDQGLEPGKPQGGEGAGEPDYKELYERAKANSRKWELERCASGCLCSR